MRKLQIAAIVAALLIGLPQLSPAQENPSDTYRQLKLFSEVFERVRADYVEEVSDQDLIEFAIQGILSTLDPHRSEEHTSELQSLMRISYAVFCLKKKKKN